MIQLLPRIFIFCALIIGGAKGQDRPNVIVMVADDLGWNDVGYHGGDIETPSLDRLAAEGVQLDRFYTPRLYAHLHAQP